MTLRVAQSAGRSRRMRIYEDGSLRVRFPNRQSASLEAVLVNTAGGVAGGDRIAIDITVEHGADVTVTSAAAEKIYRTHGPAAQIALTAHVAQGASLRWLPQETILFDEARLTRAIDADVAEGASLMLAEAVVFGRSAMGESVRDGSLFDRWRIRRDGRMVFADGLRLDGDVTARLARPAIAGGHGAVATVLMLLGGPQSDDDASVTRVRERQERYAGEVGASAWNGLILLRLVAADGARLRHDLALALAALDPRPLPRLWLS